MPNQTPGIPSDIAFITGPTLLGICLNWGFMGVLAVQVYFYHVSFPEDRRSVKLLVYGLATLDVLQTCLITADAFHWFAFGFGNMEQLDQTFLNSWDVPFLDAIISLIVQGFYCWRIYMIRKNAVVPLVIVLISLLQCVGGIWTAVRAHQLGHLSLIVTEVVPQTIWLVGGAVADVAIAVTLSWALLYKREVSLPSTKSVISRVIRTTVETNALTAGIAVVALIIFWGIPSHPTLVVPPTVILGKLYSNCLIAVFNNRALEQTRKASGANNGSHHGLHSLQIDIPVGGTVLNSSSHSSRTHTHTRSHRQNGSPGGVNVAPLDHNGVKVHVVREMEFSYGPGMEMDRIEELEPTKKSDEVYT
uniref:DUF6534 domain-containing protein n=1 Tax=Mycena chlorophos TaxID=658473 RepID=A0ABQ0LXS1_MYCCL|nr:predicted protein [Mycena chlorophos]